MTERIAVVSGARTPIGKADGSLRDLRADDLGAFAVKEAVIRAPLPASEYGELIFGSVAQPIDAPNIARVIGIKSGLPEALPAYTVQRNCASGIDSIAAASAKLLLGDAEIIVAGGGESMSNIPLFFGTEYRRFLARWDAARGKRARLQALLRFRPRFLRPVAGLRQVLTDPLSGMLMGETAELLAREFRITRREQDEYALLSHQRATRAVAEELVKDEIVPVPLPPQYQTLQRADEGPRPGQTLEQLAKLSPYFNRHTGTVTVGNSSQISDGAAAVTLMRESTAKARGVEPLGFIRGYATVAVKPERMGLGPVYATARLMELTGSEITDFELIELNEAFAAVVLANERAFASAEFARDHLNRPRALGTIDRARLNPEGGAIALGHPLGMSGTRLVLHLLHALRRRRAQTGLATLCVGGGQGTAVMLEVV